MSQHIDAIFSDGAFRPRQPVDFPEGAEVSLVVDAKKIGSAESVEVDDLSDIDDLLSHECVEECRRQISGVAVPSLEEVRRRLSAYKGSLADDIIAEREDRF